MKQILIVCFLSVFTLGAQAQNSNAMTQLETTIHAFASAADNSDVKALDQLLDVNYRIVMNRLFGSKTASIMDKATYLEKIETKVFGGDKRTVNIRNMNINGTVATAEVEMVGKMTVVSLLQFIQTADGQWKLVSDMPMM